MVLTIFGSINNTVYENIIKHGLIFCTLILFLHKTLERCNGPRREHNNAWSVHTNVNEKEQSPCSGAPGTHNERARVSVGHTYHSRIQG